MAAGARGRGAGQTKLDLLLVADVTDYYLAKAVQSSFANAAEVTITLSSMQKAAALLDDRTFDMVFLQMTSFLTTEEMETVRSFRFGKKKNTHLLFVFIISENFKGCISGHGADITLTEPLTVEKMSVVIKYWKTYFSNTVRSENALSSEEYELPLQSTCREHLGYFSADLFTCSESVRNGIGLELKTPLSDFDRSKRISLLHSSKEKLRRERIKYCCEQLRTLLPYIKGRKNDAASILEATVDYVKYILEQIPPAVTGQIAEVLQSNRRFCKKHMTTQLSLSGMDVAHRENSVLTRTYSPVTEVQFLANKCLNVYSAPAARGSLDPVVRAQSSSTPESAIGVLYKNQTPSSALSLNAFHSVRCYSKVVPSYDAAAVANQNISVHLSSAMSKASEFLPQHCTSLLGQTGTAHPNCLQQFWAY